MKYLMEDDNISQNHYTLKYLLRTFSLKKRSDLDLEMENGCMFFLKQRLIVELIYSRQIIFGIADDVCGDLGGGGYDDNEEITKTLVKVIFHGRLSRFVSSCMMSLGSFDTGLAQ